MLDFGLTCRPVHGLEHPGKSSRPVGCRVNPVHLDVRVPVLRVVVDRDDELVLEQAERAEDVPACAEDRLRLGPFALGPREDHVHHRVHGTRRPVGDGGHVSGCGFKAREIADFNGNGLLDVLSERVEHRLLGDVLGQVVPVGAVRTIAGLLDALGDVVAEGLKRGLPVAPIRSEFDDHAGLRPRQTASLTSVRRSMNACR